MTTNDTFVQHEITERTARIRLNRPAEANRIHSVMMRQFIEALDAATVAGVDVILITAAGTDFSVGRDQHEALPADMSKLDNTALIVQTNRLLTGFTGITVSAAQGRALGFGCGVVVQSDIALAADTARFGFDEIHHGTAPAFVMSYLEDYVGKKRALDLIVTGRTLSAAEAEQYGMVSRVVPEDLLGATVDALVESLLRSPGEMLSRCKAYFAENRRLPPETRLDHAFDTFAERLGGDAAAKAAALAQAAPRG
jgi:enoyl-CoA hydratase/carnithine racemase